MQLGGGGRAGTLSASRGSHHPSAAAAAAALLLGVAAAAAAGAFCAAAQQGAQTLAPRQPGQGVHISACHRNMRRRSGRGKAGQTPVLPPGEPPTMPPAPPPAPPSGRLNRTDPASRSAACRHAGVCRAGGVKACRPSSKAPSQPACAAWLAEPHTRDLHPLPVMHASYSECGLAWPTAAVGLLPLPHSLTGDV
jgi:hypothetical protein